MSFGRIGGWRGFYIAVGKRMLSCHLNGYGFGSQIAINLAGQRTGSTWYGWWSDSGWGAQRQQPVKTTVDIDWTGFYGQSAWCLYDSPQQQDSGEADV